jgi:hypothetical protein
MNHESEFIRHFVNPKKRGRYLSLIETCKGRKKFLGVLDHFDQLDTRYARLLPTGMQTIVQIEELLRQRGAPDRCHVISSNVDIDDREMLLSEALQETIGRGFGTVLSCIPGKLAYFEGEEPNQRYLLERTD